MLISLTQINHKANINFRALSPTVETAVKSNIISRRNFVPTPDNIADLMISYANIQYGDKVLEPSAGQGHIIERIHLIKPNMTIDAVEKHPLLLDELKHKQGLKVVGRDIMEYNPGMIYDTIIMNPPFNNGNPIKHGLHCFENLLKPGGTLVSIMPDYVFKNTNEFLDLIKSNFIGSKIIKLTEKTFLESDLPAKVKTSIIVLKKPTYIYPAYMKLYSLRK
jgi:tRNA1(Val) A37 N6-methylase TrmN6